MAKTNTKNNKKVSVKLFEMESYTPTDASERIHSDGLVRWGKDNRYPDYIYDTYCRCATLQSVINGLIDFTIGNNIEVNPVILNSLPKTNVDGDTFADVVVKLISDSWIFGGFAFKIYYNDFGAITEIDYVDIRRLRIDKNEQFVYLQDKWRLSLSGINDDAKFYIYDPETAKKDKVQIYYYKGHRTRGYYPMPEYSAALVSAETQIEIQEFHYNSIINNFMGNIVINFDGYGDLSKEEQDEIVREIKRDFTGAKNAANILTSFNPDNTTGLRLDRIPEDSFDQKYGALAESTRENLFIALRAIPILFGQIVSTGFNRQEYEEALAYTIRTAAVPRQNIMIQIFNKVFSIEQSLTFTQFSLNIA